MAVGIYGLVTGLRNLPYIHSLPPSAGNKAIRRRQHQILTFSLGALVIGARLLWLAMGW